MPQIKNRQPKKFYVVATVASVVTVSCIVLGGLLFNQYQQHLAEQKFNQLKTTADVLVRQRHPQQAADLWSKYAHNTSNAKQYRAKAWENAGLFYMSSADYSRAESCFKNSIAITGLTYSLASAIAQAAQWAGDKPVAIHYYQEALKLIPKDMPAVESQKRLFSETIKQLQSSP
jgi:tetratricopeptide (TPR) repeat protein